MLELTEQEDGSLRSQTVTLKGRGEHRKCRPYCPEEAQDSPRKAKARETSLRAAPGSRDDVVLPFGLSCRAPSGQNRWVVSATP